MLSNNPFSILAETVSPLAMQYFIIAMVLLIAVGTIIQMIHHKNLTYFFNNAKKAKLSATKELGMGEKASIIAAIIMVGFLFVGEEILNLIGIDINSFAVAGSFIIFFLALEMILGISIFSNDAPETASIVPLAFPMIAGAGTMTSLLSLRAEYQVLNIIFAIIINIIFVYIILKSSKYIENFLGKSGINIIRKVFGIILLAVAVKLFTSNISQLF